VNRIRSLTLLPELTLRVVMAVIDLLVSVILRSCCFRSMDEWNRWLQGEARVERNRFPVKTFPKRSVTQISPAYQNNKAMFVHIEPKVMLVVPRGYAKGCLGVLALPRESRE